MMKSTLFAAILTILLAAAASARKSRIYGGQVVEIVDHPYQVSIRYQKSHFCGGAIIGERHILTAAHCIKFGGEFLPIEDLTVHTGTSFSEEEGHVYELDKYKTHPGFDTKDGIVNDIAVVTLKEAIKFDEYQQPIALPRGGFVEAGRSANATGWGLVSQAQIAKKLKKLETKVISLEQCRAMTGLRVADEQICTLAGKGQAICTGDSGGPLALDGEIIGVVSWSSKGCGDGYPDVYMKVYDYLDFVGSAMRE